MSDAVYLLVGLAFAIPLSILANMWTPKVQAHWDARSEERAAKRSAENERYREWVEQLASDDGLYAAHCYREIARFTGLGLFTIVAFVSLAASAFNGSSIEVPIPVIVVQGVVTLLIGTFTTTNLDRFRILTGIVLLRRSELAGVTIERSERLLPPGWTFEAKEQPSEPD